MESGEYLFHTIPLFQMQASELLRSGMQSVCGKGSDRGERSLGQAPLSPDGRPRSVSAACAAFHTDTAPFCATEEILMHTPTKICQVQFGIFSFFLIDAK